jgi:hypothetical protein
VLAAERDFRLALLQSTETCRTLNPVACAGGKYDPTPSPRYNDPVPRYNIQRINRHDGPEDDSSYDRCLTGGLPDFSNTAGNFRRIVQTPGGITMFYDVSQGQGWQRHHHERQAPPAGEHPPMVRRFPRPLGGQNARH